jgi:hypothetical protein
MPDLNLFATFRFRSIECIIMRVLEHLHVHSSLASVVKVDSELERELSYDAYPSRLAKS